MQDYDVVVIGGGIVGTAVARELSKYKIKTALLESKLDVGAGTTKGNGGVVHAGYDPAPSTLKGKLNVKGNLMYPKLSKNLGFNFKNTGSFVVGFNDDDLAYLKKLLENGKRNGVPNIRIISQDEMRKIEPNINPDAKYALYAPSAGIVEPFEVAIAFAENAFENGCEIFRGQEVVGIEKIGNDFVITTPKSQYRSRYVVNAAGVYADKIANMLKIHDYTINPRHGSLLIFDKSMDIDLNTVMFPIPSSHTKGIAVIPTIAGNIIIGSTAEMVEDKEDTSTKKDEIDQLLNGAKLLAPKINPRKVIREFAGLRPVAIDNNDDFYIGASKDVRGFISVAGIQSPGVAASPAIAEYVRDILSNEGLELKEKSDFNEYRQAPVDFSELSEEEKNNLIKKDPKYGQIVCRCEYVTEGEIIDSIRRPVGALTIDGVKRRTRAGMGRCQSGFCQHKVLSILSRELNLPKDRIALDEKDSNIVFGLLKQ